MRLLECRLFVMIIHYIFDGVNEKGVGMAGLNFDGPAHYFPVQEGKDNIASFELVPYILVAASSVAEAKKLLSNANIANINFLINSKLHRCTGLLLIKRVLL